MDWTSGTRSGVIASVCRGDLISIRLAQQGGGPDTPSRQGLLPHLVYVPRFAGRDGAAGMLGGESPSADDPIEYRVDPAPFWCPYDGELYLDGGGDGTTTLYRVTYLRARCAPRPDRDPALTLHGLTFALSIPRGVYAVRVPTVTPVTFEFAGTQTTRTVSPGEDMDEGALLHGRILPPPSGVLAQLALLVRL